MDASEKYRHRETQALESREPVLPGKALHLLYHELTAQVPSNSYQIQSEMFQSHLREFLRYKHGPIRPTVTFDDGHRSNYEYALPALEEYGFKATFFITAGWVSESRGEYMSWNDLRAIRTAGHIIGAHGWSHKLFTHCDASDLKREIVDAKSALEDNLGAEVTALSFPGGRSNRNTIQVALGAGYTTLYTSDPIVETLPLGRLVGRLNIRSHWDSRFLASLLEDDQRVMVRLRRQSLFKDAAKRVLGDRLYSKLWSAVNGKEVEPESFRGSST